MTYELSYGECSVIETEWNRYKDEMGVPGSAEDAIDFIATVCMGVYDTDDEWEAVFDYIGCLEEK